MENQTETVKNEKQTIRQKIKTADSKFDPLPEFHVTTPDPHTQTHNQNPTPKLLKKNYIGFLARTFLAPTFSLRTFRARTFLARTFLARTFLTRAFPLRFLNHVNFVARTFVARTFSLRTFWARTFLTRTSWSRKFSRANFLYGGLENLVFRKTHPFEICPPSAVLKMGVYMVIFLTPRLALFLFENFIETKTYKIQIQHQM